MTGRGYFWLFAVFLKFSEFTAQEGPGIVIAHPGQDVELLCNVTGGVPSWRVNGVLYALSVLFNGTLPRHNTIGNNIIVEDIMMNDDRNGSVYICVIPQIPPTPDIQSDPTTLYVAGIDQVTGVNLTCESMGLINQCNATWLPVTQGNITGYQVYYNGTMMNVTSSTTTLTFTAPSLPDGVFTGTVVVMVTAINRFGVGPPSDLVTAKIYASSVVTATPMLMCSPVASQLYNITVTCTIHPDSTADQCVVMAMADGRVTRTGTAAITNRTATVTINDLQCGVTYNIKAEGALNGTLVGPKSPHGNVTAGPCPVIATARNCSGGLNTINESDDELSTGVAVAISIVVTFIITLVVTALITLIITSLYYKYRYELKEKVKVDDDNTKHTNDSIPMDTNPAYGTTATIKMDTNPAYATTAH